MSIHANDGRQIKKKAIKEHSASAINGMKKFVSEEAKEKLDVDKEKSMKKCKSIKKKSSGIKKTGKFEGKSNRLGGGGRFKQVEAKARASGAKNPAMVGRRSLGKAKFQRLATAGKKRNAKA